MKDNAVDFGAPFDDPHPNSDDYWADMVKITVLTVGFALLWLVSVGVSLALNWIGSML